MQGRILYRKRRLLSLVFDEPNFEHLEKLSNWILKRLKKDSSKIYHNFAIALHVNRRHNNAIVAVVDATFAYGTVTYKLGDIIEVTNFG